MVYRRLRYRQRLLQNLVISSRMVFISTADFNDRNSVVCPLCVCTCNVLLMNLTINIVMPFVFVTGTQCILCDVGCEMSYIFQIIFFVIYIIKQLVIAYSFKYNQQYATLYNILYYCQCCTCFRRFLHPSPELKTVQTAPGICQTCLLLLLAVEASKFDIYQMLCIQF
jgi:hypothetical protein